MSKHNSLIKKVKKQIVSINDSLESYFNKIRYFRLNYKKILSNKENRVFIGFLILVIFSLSYLSIPSFYNKELIQTLIKNQISKNYNINIKFNEKINYGLLPKPHFFSKNLSIMNEGNEIGVSKNLKIHIGVGKFFSFNEIDMKNLLFNKTDFNIQLKDIIFFKKLLQTAPNENEILFKNSTLFFKDKNDEVLFINKINDSRFFYDSNNLQNILVSKNEVFKVPFKLIIKNDKFNKKIFTEFDSKKIRLKIDNEINYDGITQDGLLDILFINKNTSLNYELKKDALSFSSRNNKNFYKGQLDFKPFYLSANFNYEGASFKNLFDNDSILTDLVYSEILNNKNLSANINFQIKDITNISELNDLNLNISIEEGNINLSDSTIMWKNDLKVIFSESFLKTDDGINLIGTILIIFNDIEDFYRSFQIKKKDRKKIKQIEIDYIYNFNTKNISFDNPRVNDAQNNDLEKFINIFNSKKDRNFNKITFKNFINNFFKVYSG